MSDGKRHFKTSVRRQTLIRLNKGHKKIWLFLMQWQGCLSSFLWRRNVTVAVVNGHSLGELSIPLMLLLHHADPVHRVSWAHLHSPQHCFLGGRLDSREICVSWSQLYTAQSSQSWSIFWKAHEKPLTIIKCAYAANDIPFLTLKDTLLDTWCFISVWKVVQDNISKSPDVEALLRPYRYFNSVPLRLTSVWHEHQRLTNSCAGIPMSWPHYLDLAYQTA